MGFRGRGAPLERVDARAKVAGLALLTLALVVFRLPVVALGALALDALLLLGSGVGARELWRDEKAVLAFALIPVPLQALAVPGTVLLTLGFASLSVEGFWFGVLNSLLLFGVLLAAMAFAYSTRPSEMVGALSWFRAPPAFSFSLALALKFMPVVWGEVGQVRVAQAARGARLDRPGAVFAFLVPSVHRIFSRAKSLSISLEARGFSPERKMRF